MPLLAALALALSAACARQGAPPGGPPDRRPPVVVATTPDTYAVDPDFEGPVRFTFDERISERVAGGALNDAVLLSPRTGQVRVDHDRQSLEVSVAGGFQEGQVYRLTLLPVVTDLFGNTTRDPFELVFSTGGELSPTVVAGLAWDRTTGRGAPELQVVARSTEDSTVYQARSDTGGIYAFRYLPPGAYEVVAFQDQDRNVEVGPMEVQGRRRVLLGAGDTLFTDLGVLQPDTTPAVLTAAEVLDSTTLVLRFDDPLSPQTNVGTGNVGLQALEMGDTAALTRARREDEPPPLSDTLPAPEVAGVFQEHRYRVFLREERAAVREQDSVRAHLLEQARQAEDSVRIDSLVGLPPLPLPPALPGGRAGGGVGERAAGGPGGEDDGPPYRTGPDGLPLPSQRIVVRLAGPLRTNQAYQVVATGVVNLAGLPLGGGTAVVVRTPPPAPDTTTTDSLATDSLATDSLQADSLATDSLATDTPRDSTPPVDSLPGPAIQPPAPRPDTTSQAPDSTATVLAPRTVPGPRYARPTVRGSRSPVWRASPRAP